MKLEDLRVISLAVCLPLIFVPASIMAETIQIQFTGLDLKYENEQIHDLRSAGGGTGDSADADPLANLTFLLDGVVVGTLTSGDLGTEIFADILIDQVTGIPAGGGEIIHTGGGSGYFDIFASSNGYGLGLRVDTLNIYYSDNRVTLAADAVVTGFGSQQLPFGLEFDQDKPIFINFSSVLSNVEIVHDYVVSFKASGTGSVTGTLVPEPSCLTLALIGALGLLVVRRWRRKW